jgi:hypothetical protein
MKLLIKYAIKQLGTVGVGSSPVKAGQVPVVPGAGAADRPQETLYKKI